MVNSEQVASRLLDSISKPINFDPDRLARVAGQFITRNGIQVYPARTFGWAARRQGWVLAMGQEFIKPFLLTANLAWEENWLFSTAARTSFPNR